MRHFSNKNKKDEDLTNEWEKYKAKKRENLSTQWIDDSVFSPESRYVFFLDLKETHPDIYRGVQSHFSHIKNFFNNSEQEEEQDFDEKLQEFNKTYINFLYQIATREKNNEIMYMGQLIDRAKEELSKKEYLAFKAALNKKRINYPELVHILNLHLQNKELYKKNLQDQINNFILIQENAETQDEEQIKQMRDDYIRAYTNYTKQFGDLLKQSREEKDKSIRTYKQTWNTLITDAINHTLKNIDVQQLQNELARRNYKYTPSSLEKLIKTVIVGQAVEAVKTGSMPISSMSTNILAQKIIDQADDLYSSLFTAQEKLAISLEEHALKSGKDLYKTYTNYNKTLQDNFNNTYLPYLNSEEQKKLQKYFKTIDNEEKDKKKTSKAKENISKLLRKAITEAKRQYKQTNPSATDEDFINAYSVLRQAQNSIAKNLTITVLKAPAAAEAMAQPTNKNMIIKNLYIPGGEIKLRNDIMFSCIFDPDNWLPQSWFDKFLNKSMNKFQKDFLTKYHNVSNTINVDKAFNAYMDTIPTTSEEPPQMLEEYKTSDFPQYFFNSISVKEYEFYSNDLGFHGGSLGNGGRAESAITNILKMYELGGINTLDADFMIQAVLNSGSDTVLTETNPDLLDIIKNYLVGGAALMMFDDGFSNFDKVIKKWQEIFLNHNAPKTIHLYYLNNVYVPQSYILFAIHDNLINFMLQIQQENNTSKKNSRIEIVNPITYEESVQYFDDQDTSPERWEIVSRLAKDNITIEFLFMAGLLDLLQNIVKVFNDPET